MKKLAIHFKRGIDYFGELVMGFLSLAYSNKYGLFVIIGDLCSEILNESPVSGLELNGQVFISVR